MTTTKLVALVRSLRHMGKREWGGYLTPSDYLDLLGQGGVGKPNDIARSKVQKEKGLSTPDWKYFTTKPGSTLERLLRENHPKGR